MRQEACFVGVTALNDAQTLPYYCPTRRPRLPNCDPSQGAGGASGCRLPLAEAAVALGVCLAIQVALLVPELRGTHTGQSGCRSTGQTRLTSGGV